MIRAFCEANAELTPAVESNRNRLLKVHHVLGNLSFGFYVWFILQVGLWSFLDLSFLFQIVICYAGLPTPQVDDRVDPLRVVVVVVVVGVVVVSSSSK